MKNKKLSLLIITAVAALILSGCSGKKKELSVDVAKLADDLNSQTVTSDTLTASVPEMIAGIYNLNGSDLESAAAYKSAGSTALEIAVFACADAKKTEDIKKTLEAHIKSQSDLYASYAPDQVEKLKNAVLKTGGKYVVLAVCDDTAKAESILKEAGF